MRFFTFQTHGSATGRRSSKKLSRSTARNLYREGVWVSKGPHRSVSPVCEAWNRPAGPQERLRRPGARTEILARSAPTAGETRRGKKKAKNMPSEKKIRFHCSVDGFCSSFFLRVRKMFLYKNVQRICVTWPHSREKLRKPFCYFFRRDFTARSKVEKKSSNRQKILSRGPLPQPTPRPKPPTQGVFGDI